MMIGPETTKVLESLRAHPEYEEEGEDGMWAIVYLDNARPEGMKPTTFRSYLAKLAQHGLYRPYDSFSFGKVRL